MKQIKNTKPKTLSILLSPEELNMIELIKKTYIRKTFSDTVRFLLVQESKKILDSRATIGA